jgi:hypothetical protein
VGGGEGAGGFMGGAGWGRGVGMKPQKVSEGTIGSVLRRGGHIIIKVF